MLKWVDKNWKKTTRPSTHHEAIIKPFIKGPHFELVSKKCYCKKYS